jgi:hypothetical protein
MSHIVQTFRRAAIISLCAVLVTACATPLPKVASPQLGYAVSAVEVDANSDETGLSTALNAAILGASPVSNRTVSAAIDVDLLRYDAPIIGLFYGGKHHASISVVLKDEGGRTIDAFAVNAADNGEKANADAALAKRLADIIAAKAAAAYPLMTAKPKAAAKVQSAPKVIEAPIAEAETVEADIDTDAAPCVIGPDGKCQAL